MFVTKLMRCITKFQRFVRFLSSTGETSSSRNINKIVEHLLKTSTQNVVVLAGAGISTLSGIPDFRSPKSGLYHNLQKYDLPYPEAIFDIHYFHQNQRPFFSLAKEIYPGNFKPNVAHFFVKLLNQKNKLLRMYTQNIDGLEKIAGVPPAKLVEAHGSFDSATCLTCGNKYSGKLIKKKIFADIIPKCEKTGCDGIIKPDITFFGEQLPERFGLHAKDLFLTDMLIVMGTSLEVQPFASLSEIVPEIIPRLLINRHEVGHFLRKHDVFLKGDIAETVFELTERLGWLMDLQQLCLAEAS